MSDEIPLDKLVRVYMKIRDARAELSKEFKTEDGKLVEQLDQIKRALLDHCKETGQTSGHTEAGQFIRSIKTKYWTSDWDSMNKFIIENDLPEFYTKSLNQSNVKAFMEQNPDKTPPGLNVESEYIMTVKKARKTGG